MYAGRLAETGPISLLHDRPLHPYTERLMTSVADVDGPRRLAPGIAGQPPDLASPPTGCRFHPRCDRAMDICAREVPGERAFGAGHRVACHAVSAGGELPAAGVRWVDAVPPEARA